MKLKLKEINQFCSSSSIHGVQYFAPDGKATTCDKLIWLTALSTSLGFCFLLLVNMNKDWSSNPVITAIESTSEPLTNIPYPAITICNDGLDIWAFNQRVLNYIDIDCGPDGNCPDDVMKARNDFQNVFDSAWNKTIKTVDESKPDLSIFRKICSNNKPYSKKIKADQLCIAAGQMFSLALSNKSKSEEVVKNIIGSLARGHPFVNMTVAQMNKDILGKIEKELSIVSASNETISFNMVCPDTVLDNCNRALTDAMKFYFKIGALTSRVTKLGTLMVWANAYDLVKGYFNELGKRMAPDSTDIDFKDLIMRLSSDQYSDIPKPEHEKIKNYDQTSPMCLKYLSNTSTVCSNEDKCCCDSSACNTGSLDLILKGIKSLV